MTSGNYNGTMFLCEGKLAIFNCVLTPQYPVNSETILYMWTKNNKDIGFNSRTTGKMEIKAVSKSDAWNYVCTVSNVAGTNESDINITVIGKFKELCLLLSDISITVIGHAGTWRHLKIGAGPGLCNDLRQWTINLKKAIFCVVLFGEYHHAINF